ncbi:MAG TPA: hypothetical protein VM122_00920 [Usitatibacter sp.]|nr:hypothetical protein [Usitatibacter sp.]
MGFFEEYALLGAIGLPIAIVAASNVYLAITGESGTLLLPGPSRFQMPCSEGPPDDGTETAASGGA